MRPAPDTSEQQNSRHLPQLAPAAAECLSPAPDKQGLLIIVINNGNRTEWSPIRYVIIRMIKNIGRLRSGLNCILNWTTQSSVIN